MPTKRDKFRNEQRKGFTRNFSRYTIDRYIIIDNDLMNDTEKDIFIKEVNERLWFAIQETNMLLEDRLLPFVVVRRVDVVDNKLRIIVNDFDSQRNLLNYDETENLDLTTVSHIINFKPLSPQRRIVISDHFIPGNAKMLIDEHEQVSAAVDIFLDIAMFNSISFLKNLSIEAKQQFNEIKYSFFERRKLRSFYTVDKKCPPHYFSFAFYAREDSTHIDYYRYVWIWKEFISQFFKNEHIENVLPEVALRDFYVDKGNIDKCYFDRRFWESQDKGAKLFLRTNRGPNTNERKQIISDYFGIESFSVGAIKLVPLHEYYMPFINTQMRELYISAFKIIV